MTLHLGSRSGHHDDEAPHEDYGRLLLDLLATGAKLSARNFFRIASSFGASASVFQLLGCGTTSDLTGTTDYGSAQRIQVLWPVQASSLQKRRR